MRKARFGRPPPAISLRAADDVEQGAGGAVDPTGVQAVGSLKNVGAERSGGRAVGDDPALGQHYDPVGRPRREGEVVQRDDDPAAGRRKTLQQRGGVELVAGVETAERLVG
jgi:hypothetical protein